MATKMMSMTPMTSMTSMRKKELDVKVSLHQVT